MRRLRRGPSDSPLNSPASLNIGWEMARNKGGHTPNLSFIQTSTKWSLVTWQSSEHICRCCSNHHPLELTWLAQRRIMPRYSRQLCEMPWSYAGFFGACLSLPFSRSSPRAVFDLLPLPESQTLTYSQLITLRTQDKSLLGHWSCFEKNVSQSTNSVQCGSVANGGFDGKHAHFVLRRWRAWSHGSFFAPPGLRKDGTDNRYTQKTRRASGPSKFSIASFLLTPHVYQLQWVLSHE